MQCRMLPTIPPSDWLIMSCSALGVGDVETAELYVSEAARRLQNSPACCVGELLSDSRGDALATLAAIRLTQSRLSEAGMLLQLARDAHAQVADLEQLAVDIILLSDCERLRNEPSAAEFLLSDARRLVENDCVPERHRRREILLTIIGQRQETLIEDAQERRRKISMN